MSLLIPGRHGQCHVLQDLVQSTCHSWHVIVDTRPPWSMSCTTVQDLVSTVRQVTTYVTKSPWSHGPLNLSVSSAVVRGTMYHYQHLVRPKKKMFSSCSAVPILGVDLQAIVLETISISHYYLYQALCFFFASGAYLTVSMAYFSDCDCETQAGSSGATAMYPFVDRPVDLPQSAETSDGDTGEWITYEWLPTIFWSVGPEFGSRAKIRQILRSLRADQRARGKVKCAPFKNSSDDNRFILQDRG